MRIDWFTVIAQIINFLLLAWLMKRFLYQPILNAIESREKAVEKQIADAREREADAGKEQARFEKKIKQLDEERDDRLTQVEQEANEKRERLMEKIRAESEALRLKLEADLKEEEKNINREISDRIRKAVLEISGKTLSDLGSASLEAQIIKVFIERVSSLTEDKQKELKSAFSNAVDGITVKSAFQPDDDAKHELERAVNHLTGKQGIFHYTIEPSMIGGIGLFVKNYKLEWSIEDYLSDLERQMGALFESPYAKEEKEEQGQNEQA